MTGIEILAEYTAGGMHVAAIVVFTMFAVLGLIIFIAGCICGDDDIPGVGVHRDCRFSCNNFLSVFMAEPEHTQYKVTISEDVKIVEFLEQYEILDTEGDIYTIREVIPDA